jgi:hypothetical protein
MATDDRCWCAGCVGMGPCDNPPQPEQCPDCTLAEGHSGQCEWFCGQCAGSGECWACDGDGEDGSGLPGTCMECGGGGQCTAGCFEGMWSELDVMAWGS